MVPGGAGRVVSASSRWAAETPRRHFAARHLIPPRRRGPATFFAPRQSVPVLPPPLHPRTFSCSTKGQTAASIAHGKAAASRSSKQVIFSGIQPTGTPHIGNLLGALFNWVQLQNSSPKDAEIYFSIVGLHALTMPQDPAVLRKERLDMLAALLAVGLDPERCTLYHQDEVAQHSELHWLLSCLINVGRLARMTTWKSKLATAQGKSEVASSSSTQILVDQESLDLEGTLNLGLFSYPVLQAADILLYKATHVPVGEDQIQHLELARDIAESFNRRYRKVKTSTSKPAQSTFPTPQPLITPTPRVLSLRDPTSKMSKSAPDLDSRILLTDDRQTIDQKIKRAVTDSERTLSYDPDERPGVANLLRIATECGKWSSTLTGASQGHFGRVVGDAIFPDCKDPETFVKELSSRLGDSDSPSKHLKTITSKFVAEAMDPIRERYLSLREDTDKLLEIGEYGRNKAAVKAAETLKEVKEKMGLSS